MSKIVSLVVNGFTEEYPSDENRTIYDYDFFMSILEYLRANSYVFDSSKDIRNLIEAVKILGTCHDNNEEAIVATVAGSRQEMQLQIKVTDDGKITLSHTGTCSYHFKPYPIEVEKEDGSKELIYLCKHLLAVLPMIAKRDDLMAILKASSEMLRETVRVSSEDALEAAKVTSSSLEEVIKTLSKPLQVAYRCAFKKPQNLMLVGGAGCGKSFEAGIFFKCLGETFGEDLVTINACMNPSTEASDLIGFTYNMPIETQKLESSYLENAAAKMATFTQDLPVFVAGPVGQAIIALSKGKKVVLFIDEANRGSQRVLNTFTSFLVPAGIDKDGNAYSVMKLPIYTDIRNEDGTWVTDWKEVTFPSENLITVFACNEGADYEVNYLDPAIRSRFQVINYSVTEESFYNVLTKNLVRFMKRYNVSIEDSVITSLIKAAWNLFVCLGKLYIDNNLNSCFTGYREFNNAFETACCLLDGESINEANKNILFAEIKEILLNDCINLCGKDMKNRIEPEELAIVKKTLNRNFGIWANS